MYQRVHCFIQQQMDCLLAQDYETMLAARTLPYRVTIPTGTMVMTSQHEVLESLQFRTAKYLRMGVTKIETNVVAVNLPRGENFQAWAEFQLFCGTVGKVYSASAIYYLTYRDDLLSMSGLKISYSEMNIPIPEKQLAQVS